MGESPNIQKLIETRDIEGLINALGLKDENIVRVKATEALGEMKEIRAIEPIIGELNSIFLRKVAIKALVNIGGSSVEPLIAALRHDDKEIAKRAAEVLGSIGDPRAIEPLITLLKDSDSEICRNAARALRKIRDPRSIELLGTVLNDKDGVARMMAVSVLGEISDSRIVEPLIIALHDPDSNVKKEAVNALGKIDNPGMVVVNELLLSLINANDVVYDLVIGVLNKKGIPGIEQFVLRVKEFKRRQDINNYPKGSFGELFNLFSNQTSKCKKCGRNNQAVLTCRRCLQQYCIDCWNSLNLNCPKCFEGEKLTIDSLFGKYIKEFINEQK